MNCKVKSLVYYEHQPNDFVVEHSHHCFECVYYLEGSGNIFVENESYFYDGPTFTVVKPGLMHDEKTDTKSKLFILLFDCDEPDTFSSFNIFKVDQETNQKIKSMFERMLDEEKNKDPYYQEMISSMFSAILIRFARDLDVKKVSSNKEMVERTKAYIKENYKQDIDFEKIAFNVGYSFDRFRHIFKEETGVSIHQYLLNCRLYVAKQLLLNPSISVKDVAKSCGFDSIVHFNNFFKAKMQISPHQFRKASTVSVDEGVFTIDGVSNKEVIIDTDIGGDCDDAGALALANMFHRTGKLKILAMTYTCSSIYGPACIDSINNFYGNCFDIGQSSRKNYMENVNPFQKVLATEFPNRIYNPTNKKVAPVMDAIKLLRKKLSNAKDNSVTIVCIGQLNNMSDLLDSKPDEYSPLDGVNLCNQKVCEFVVMGGMFPQNNETIYFEGSEYKVEYNIASDITSSINFINKCSNKITFVDFITGYNVLTGQSLFDQNNERNPVTMAYRIFQNKPRQSWDLLALWYATFGKCNFFKLSKEGKISISKDGTTTHDLENKCGHYYTMLNCPTEEIVKKINQALISEE